MSSVEVAGSVTGGPGAGVVPATGEGAGAGGVTIGSNFCAVACAGDLVASSAVTCASSMTILASPVTVGAFSVVGAVGTAPFLLLLLDGLPPGTGDGVASGTIGTVPCVSPPRGGMEGGPY